MEEKKYKCEECGKVFKQSELGMLSHDSKTDEIFFCCPYCNSENYHIYIAQKPSVDLTDVDGNIFSIIAKVKKTMERKGLNKEAVEMANRVIKSKSYEEALTIIEEYVDF